MQLIDISVVICTYNRFQLLREALKDIICQETDGRFNYEILVVDDGSTDKTKEVVDELASNSNAPVRYVCGEGKGYTHALNSGIAESRGEWIAFFDDDQQTAPNWLKELFSTATEAGVYLVGGPIVLAMPEAERLMLGPRVRALRGEHPPSCGIFRRSKKPPLPGGGNRLVKRTVFDSIGVFDEKMQTGGCDMDMVVRARDAGFNNAWAPKAIVRHLVPAYRLEQDHIRWSCLQGGCAFAYIDWKRWGWHKALLVCVARLGYTLIVSVPFLLLGYLRRSSTSVLDNKIQLWRNIGYTRKALFLVAPKLFAQNKFFYPMNFRKEREAFSKDSCAVK